MVISNKLPATCGRSIAAKGFSYISLQAASFFIRNWNFETVNWMSLSLNEGLKPNRNSTGQRSG
jgi:hypothetical protein